MAENDNPLLRMYEEKRQNIWAEIKKITDLATAEKRELSADEAGRFDSGSADLDALAARCEQIRATDKQNAEVADYLARTIKKPQGDPTGDAEQELRTFLSKSGRSGFLDLPAPKGAMLRAIANRALTKGVPTAGGNTVPTTFYDQLMQHLVDASSVLQAGPTILNTSSGEQISVPITTSHGGASIVPEGGNIATGSTDPAFGQRTLSAYKYGQLVQLSRELVEDTAVDLLGYIATACGRNVGLSLGTDLLSGTGGGVKPTGILTSATAGITGATGTVGAFTADNLIDLMFSIIAPYRNSTSAAWLLKDGTLGAVRKLKDGSGRYLWEMDVSGLSGSGNGILLGKPVYTAVDMPSVGLGAKSVLFGDISRYMVRLAGGVRFERSDEFAFGTDLISFRVLIRADGILYDQTGAVKYFTGGAT